MQASASPDLEFHRPLLTALLDLQRLISTIPDQSMHRMAEYAAATWSRVLDGKEAVQPRLNGSGYLPEAFHFGMEARPENQIDPVSPGLTAPEFRQELAGRLAGLRGTLERFFRRTGYRNSTDQCDQLMV
ncbi:MAG TPA: hypothetical protein VL359_19920, partial [bacterium]|nr:hypothetical protein [bacterium]